MANEKPRNDYRLKPHMNEETEETVAKATEKNGEQWRTHIKYEKGKLIESAIVLSIIASLTAFVIGYIFGAKIGF